MRYIRLACALILTAGVSAFGAVDPALLSLVPTGSRFVAAVQLSQARSSEFGQYVLSRLDVQDEDLREFTQETGFDPRHDVDEFVYASVDQLGHRDDTRFVVLARGSFDQSRILAKAKAHGWAAQSYRGVDLIEDREAHRGTGLAFLDGGIAVMADGATLRQIVANRNTPSSLNPVLQDQIEKVSADHDAWFASIASGSFVFDHMMEHEMKQPVANAQALQSIVASSGGIHFGDVVAFTFDAKTRSAQDAVSLGDVLRFGGSMVQMQRQNDSRAAILASAVDKMNISTNGPTLHASFSLTEKNLEELAGLEPRTPNHTRR